MLLIARASDLLVLPSHGLIQLLDSLGAEEFVERLLEKFRLGAWRFAAEDNHFGGDVAVLSLKQVTRH